MKRKPKADHVVEALNRHKRARLDSPTTIGTSQSADDLESKCMLSFISSDGTRDNVDLRFLNDAPNLRAPLLRAFRIWGQSAAQRTRIVASRNLRVGLVTFLRESDRQNVTLDDLDDHFFFGFIQWLNKPRIEMNLRPWAHGTRDALLTPVRTLINALTSDPSYGRGAAVASESVPDNPWDGISSKSIPVERMQMDDLRRLIGACESEIRAIEKRLNTYDLCEAGHEDCDDFEKCLRAFSERFDGVLPTRREIQRHHPDLFPLIKASGFLRRMPDYLYAQPRDLVPFVLLVAVSTAFNADTVLELDRRRIHKDEHLGGIFVTISGVKKRATTDQVATVSDTSASDLGILRVLAILDRLTERLRKSDDGSHDRHLLFLYSPATRGDKKPRGFLNRNRSNGVGIWQHSLKRFISDNKLNYFNLRRIRPTLIDETWFRTGDITIVKQFSQHRHAATLWKHYTSDGTRKRFKERIGETILLQERWWRSDGIIDPRTSVRPSNMDRGAATPGFLCFDPFDSPRPGQLSNALCSGYGECASCPNAAASASDPAAAALYIAMHRAILDSRVRIDPLSWAAKWESVVDDFAALIGSLPESVVRGAMAFRTTLPGVA